MNMIRNKAVFLLAIGSFFSCELVAQDLSVESFLPTVVDVRSAAMGRTAIVTSAGSSALFSNPAMLASLTTMEGQAGGRLFLGTASIDEQGSIEGISYTPHLKLDHFSFSSPYQFANATLKFAFGVGYQTYYDFGATFKIEFEDGEQVSDVSGGLNTISPAVAVSFQDRYFGGISFNKSVFGDITEVVEVDGEEVGDDEVESSGSFFLLSGLAHVTPELTVGVTYRPSFEWEWELDSGGDIDWDFPSLIGIGVAYQVAPTLLVAGEFQNRPFSDYEVDGNDFDTDDGFCFRVGAELQNTVPLRFGLFRDALLTTDDDSDDPRSLLGVTGGAGFNVGPVALDTALEVSTWSREFDDGDDYRETLFRLRVSARYSFQ